MMTLTRRRLLSIIICITIACLSSGSLYAGSQTIKDPTDKDIVALSKAERLESENVGISGDPSILNQSFQKLKGQIARVPNGDLMWLTAHGTAAGRIYSALLTRSKNLKEGEHLMLELLDDDSPVQKQQGCIVSQSSVSDIGSHFVATGSVMHFNDQKGVKPIYFDQLMTAQQFADHLGGDGGRYLEFMIFRAALKNAKLLHREDLETLLKKATPAGRLYAAALMEKAGFKPRAQALLPLLSDKARVKYVSGCKSMDTKVFEVAKQIKEKGKFHNFDVKAVE